MHLKNMRLINLKNLQNHKTKTKRKKNKRKRKKKKWLFKTQIDFLKEVKKFLMACNTKDFQQKKKKKRQEKGRPGMLYLPPLDCVSQNINP